MTSQNDTADQDSDNVISPQNNRIRTSHSKEYWEKIPADVNGMLGGYPQLHKVDIQTSRNFLAKIGIGKKKGLRMVGNILEGGAGIGRVTKGLLLEIAERVDIIEPVKKFTDVLAATPGVGSIYNVGLEGWNPPSDQDQDHEPYDLIWIQWCLYFLTDDQLISFLSRCKSTLRTKDVEGSHAGYIIIKENVSSSAVDTYDETDSSVTRTDSRLRDLITAAGLRVLRTEVQRGFPRDLMPVRIYALRPASIKS